MAYLPPLNGGRLNASITGNTTGTPVLMSSGTMYLSGGSNVTLSQSNGSIGIAGPSFINSNGVSFSTTNGSQVFASVAAAGAGLNTIGASLGNVSGNVGAISGPNLQYVFAGGSNITLSQSITSNSATVTISGPNYVAAFSAGAGSISSGTLVFSNSNGINFGVNGQTITASYTGGAASINFSASNTSANLASLTFSNANNISFGLNNGVLTASNLPDGVQGIIAGAATITSGTLSFADSNGVSFGLNGNTVTASAGGVRVGSYYDNMLQGASSQNIAYASLITNAGAANHLLVQPLDPSNDDFPFNMTVSTLLMNFSNAGSSNQSGSHASTYYFGLYTRVNSTQLTLVNSVSASISLAANASNSLSYQGARWLTVHSSQFSVVPALTGDVRYYFAWLARTSGTYYTGNSVGGLYYGQSNARSGFMGAVSSSNVTLYGWHPFMGVHTNTTINSLPPTIANSEVNKASTYANFIPQVIFNGGGGQLF
jgi:hypothetical protein